MIVTITVMGGAMWVADGMLGGAAAGTHRPIGPRRRDARRRRFRDGLEGTKLHRPAAPVGDAWALV